jgi:imidazolonepropionase-like amidohydrolase
MRTLFHGGQVFDGTGAPLAAADLVIEDGRVVEIGSDLDGDEGVDCAAKALLPGLFDCHVHLAIEYEDLVDQVATQNKALSQRILNFPNTAMKTLSLGITTVRDASMADVGMKRAIDSGLVIGPRMQVSLTMLSMTGGHGDNRTISGAERYAGMEYPGLPTGICDGVEGCGRKVREVIRAGADVVKISASGGFFSPGDDPERPNFLQEELDAIVTTAGDLGRSVMAHSHGAEPSKRAVRAGVRSVEHGTFLDDEAIEMMKAAGTWLVPTLTTGDTTEALANDPRLPDPIRAKFATLGRPELGMFRRAADAGVKVALGTDCPVAPHGTNLRELQLMAEHGYTPEQALVAATSSAAELMGLEADLGTLEPGKIADVVVVDGDPYEFATLAERIDQVWKDGVRVV